MGISPLLKGYFPEGSFVWLTFYYSVPAISTDVYFNFSSTKLLMIQGILYALTQTVCVLLSKFAAVHFNNTFEYSH